MAVMALCRSPVLHSIRVDEIVNESPDRDQSGLRHRPPRCSRPAASDNLNSARLVWQKAAPTTLWQVGAAQCSLGMADNGAYNTVANRCHIVYAQMKALVWFWLIDETYLD